MGRADQWYCFPCKQVNCCQQGKRAKTDIFIIPPYGTGLIGARDWRTVLCRGSGCLYPRLLIIWQRMDGCTFLWDQVPFLIKLQGYLFINDKHVMHFGIKIRIPPLAVISNLERAYFGIGHDLAQSSLCYSCHTRMPFFFRNGINEPRKTGRIP